MEKMKAGLEYSYADAEVEARKTQAILWCEEYNAIDGRDFAAQYAYLKKMLSVLVEGDAVHRCHVYLLRPAVIVVYPHTLGMGEQSGCLQRDGDK